MKHLILFSTVLFLFISNATNAQTEKKETKAETVATSNKTTKVDAEKLKKFVGKYNLSEGNIILEIVQEKDKMFIKSPWGKDPLKVQDKNTLIEPTRGVYLTVIKDNDKALKYFQNGYETTIKKIDSK